MSKFVPAVLLLLLISSAGYSAVEIYQVQATPLAPTFIDYRLNCSADLTIEVLPSDPTGVPTGDPAVKTAVFPGQAKGKHRYIWPGTRDNGSPASVGYYVARITASATQTQWDPIVGVFTRNDYDTEQSARPLPTSKSTRGFYSAVVNKNPDSPYYGRIYVSNDDLKAILMYEPDGTYIGKTSSGIAPWSSTGPADLCIAADDYLYVADNYRVRILTPDCSSIVSQTSDLPGTWGAHDVFVRVDPGTGVTYVYVSSAQSPVLNGYWDEVWMFRVSADHTTWDSYIVSYTPGEGTHGAWVSPDRSHLYQCLSMPYVGGELARWDAQQDGLHYDLSTWKIDNLGEVHDVCASPDESALWITECLHSQTSPPGGLRKFDVATRTELGPFDVIENPVSCCTDAVGNVAVTFGGGRYEGSPPTGQPYWGLFAESGTNTRAKLTSVFQLPTNPAPVVVPGSAIWAPDNTIDPDDSDSASVSFKVMDVNGWQDITSVSVRLTCLGYASNTACTITQDTSDPNGLAVIATLSGIKAKVGVRCTTGYGQPPHYLAATATDTVGGSNIDPTELVLNVTGDPMFDAYIRHREVLNWYVDGAQLVATGGGIPGATDPCAAGPFTYVSAPSDTSGYASLELSAGSFGITAQKLGFGSETPVNITAPFTGFTLDIYLRPLSIGEAKALPDGTMVNVKGVCFAWPEGYDRTGPTPIRNANGLAARRDAGLDTCEWPVTSSTMRNQWYVCDPGESLDGILFMVTAPDESFPLQWDDEYGTDTFGNSTYIGKRTGLGETTMVTGVIDTPIAQERRVRIRDCDLLAGMSSSPCSADRWYKHLGDPGGLPVEYPATIPELQTLDHGSYVWVNQGLLVTGVFTPTNGYPPYLTAQDDSGHTLKVTMETPASLGITVPEVGDRWSFRGALGMGSDGGTTIRIRWQSDIIPPPPPPLGPVKSIRGEPTGTYVNKYGIVTLVGPGYVYLEDEDRGAGVRVQTGPTGAASGDMLRVVGILGMDNGERVITPTESIVEMGSTAVPSPLGLRTRDVGGHDYGPYDPGVTAGRGALNVGLLAHISGMVTAVDPGGQWFYIWDGANSSDTPVGDGTGRLGVRIESTLSCVPWTDWVDVTGVVSADSTIVPGRVIPVVLPTSVDKVTSFDTVTADAGTAIASSWNLLSLPAAPAGIGDGNEWSPKPWDPYIVLGPNQSPDDIDGRFQRWENCTGGLMIWDQWSEVGSHGLFAGVVLGDGYWLDSPGNWAVSYSAKTDALDQCISICAPGWMIIGQPSSVDTPMADIKVHDGKNVRSMYDAVLTNNWIDCTAWWWDNSTQGLVDVGIPDCWASSDTLVPWHGYWMQVYEGDKSLIMPGDDSVAPPAGDRLVVCLDCSGSMYPVSEAIEGIAATVEYLDENIPGLQVGGIKFYDSPVGSNPFLVCQPTDPDSFINWLRSSPNYGGGLEPQLEALWNAADMFDSCQFIALATDEPCDTPISLPYSAAQVRDKLLAKGCRVFIDCESEYLRTHYSYLAVNGDVEDNLKSWTFPKLREAMVTGNIPASQPLGLQSGSTVTGGRYLPASLPPVDAAYLKASGVDPDDPNR